MSTSRSTNTTTLIEELGLLIDAVEDYAIFLLSPEGEVLSWNTGAERIMGYREEEVRGRHFSLFYGGDDLAARKPEYELDTASREGRVEDEGWRIRKDGTRFWANTIITALRNEDGSIRGFAKVTRDVTLRREAEEKLRQSREIFQLLVTSVRDYAIFMLDPEGNVASWNEGAQRIKGYTPEEIIGRHFSTFYQPEDRQRGKPQWELDTARERGSVEDEGWRVRKDGTRFWANVLLTAVYDEKKRLRGFAKVTRDITERKQAEETRQALLEQREARLVAEEEQRRTEASYRVALEANRAKDEFLMMLSHELRTPMTAIIGWARMLPVMSPDDPMFHQALASILSGAQLQARMIDDMLDVSRIVSGKLRLNPEPVQIAPLIINAMDAIKPTAEAKQISVEAILSPALGNAVVDPARIQQVVWNLLSNAVKFTPRGGAVQVSARRNENAVEIEVRDSGEGIERDFLPHVFEPFRQAEAPLTRVHGGLGLGLSIVRHLVEAHGGRISASSEGRGKGASFLVTLPTRAAASPSDRDWRPARQEFPYRGRLREKRIVVVEDDPDTRAMVSAALRNAGAQVDAYGSAVEALASIEEQPDMLLTDLAMPELDGVSLAAALRQSRGMENAKIVALTAFPATAGREGDFDACLSKPVDPFQLVDEISRILGR